MGGGIDQDDGDRLDARQCMCGLHEGRAVTSAERVLGQDEIGGHRRKAMERFGFALGRGGPKAAASEFLA